MNNFSLNNRNFNSLFFIAEIGINHNGNLDIAKKLIDIAVDSGCDAVKFQKRNLDTVYTQEYLSSERKSPWGATQRQQKEGLEFGKTEYDIIDNYCKQKDIMWSASAWDTDSQKFLREYNLPFNKIASAMLTHTEFLQEVASEGRHTFISTGMSTYEDIDKAVNIFTLNNCPFTLLHCVSTYPCKDEDCNIDVINTLRNKYACNVGYSGHEGGIFPSLLAVANGATVIERHITIDKTMYGSDQSASLEPSEIKKLIEKSRLVVDIIGNGKKVFLEEEIPIAKKLRYFQ